MKALTTLALLAVTASAIGQHQSTSQINSEFNNVNELSEWKWLHETEGWPNKVKTFEVKDGNLKMEMGP